MKVLRKHTGHNSWWNAKWDLQIKMGIAMQNWNFESKWDLQSKMGLGNGEVNWEKEIKMGSENQMGIEKQNVHIQYTY